MPLHFVKTSLTISTLCVVLIGCNSAPASTKIDIKTALTLYASFDEGYAADFAKGDPVLYTTASWDMASGITAITGEEGIVARLTEGGRSGGALRFSTDWNPIVFFKGKENVGYEDADWSGAFSFWLRIDPASGLAPGYSDPFLITDKNWDNSSLYVDFTEDNPRHFRFAVFSDYSTWNPEGKSWEDYPAKDRPMIDLEKLPFAANEWTHVVLNFAALNSGKEKARIIGYLNGEKIGVLEGHAPKLSWDMDKVLMSIGRHYAGDFDDLAVFNRELSDEEVQSLYTSPLIDLF